MASEETTRNPKQAPEYACHRIVKETGDTLPETIKEHGINMAQHEIGLIQVVPAGGANPNVAVLWWSDEAGAFVQEHTPITKAGVGVNTPYEFHVTAYGRILFVAVTGGVAAGQSVRVMVSGTNVARV